MYVVFKRASCAKLVLKALLRPASLHATQQLYSAAAALEYMLMQP